MKTSVEALEGNKVKLVVEVDEQEFEKAINAAFKRIAHQARIPGFRPGKAPRRVLEAHFGTEAARQEALREALPEYFVKAVTEHDVDVIAPPEIDITAGEESGAVSFDAVVEVRPKVSVPGYANLRVTIPSPEVSDEELDAQIERLRGQFGTLETVDRSIQDDDHVTIDISASADGEPVEGLTADDYLYKVGSGAVVAELDDQLRGAKIGDILSFDASHPDPDEDLDFTFKILVKEVKHQVLPDLNDEWANEASEFETLVALRDDMKGRLSAMKRVQSQLALHEKVVEALVSLVDEDPPEALVSDEVNRRAQDLVQRLEAQGADVNQYLQAMGSTGEELGAQLREQAIEAVKSDLALRAVVEAEGIDATDDDLDSEIERFASRMNQKPAALRRQLERAEQLQAVRSDIKRGKALQWLVEHVEIVDEEGHTIDRAAIQPLINDSPLDELDAFEADNETAEEQE